jgi:hypothetical protein
MNGELRNVHEKMVVDYFKQLSQCLPTADEENHKKTITVAAFQIKIQTGDLLKSNNHFTAIAGRIFNINSSTNLIACNHHMPSVAVTSN